MYNQNQQMQLPFPTDRPIQQQYQIDVNRPPFVPNLTVSPWIQPYLPYLTGVMMDFITQKSANGPISMFFYNQMCYNNWQNQEFVETVAYCADFIYMENQHFTPQQNQIGEVFSRAVMTFVEMRSVYSIKQYPQLWNFIAEPDRRGFQQMHFAYETIVNNINSLRAATPAGPMPGQPVGYGMPPGYGQPQMGMGYPQQQQPQAPMGAAFQHQQSSYGPQGGMRAPMGAPAPGGGRSYDSTGTPPAPPQAPQAPQAPMAAPMQAPGPNQAQPPKGPNVMNAPQPQASAANLVDPADYSWKFTPEVPYPPVYNPVTHELKYSLGNNNTTKPVLIEGNTNVIDYNRHDIATFFGKPPVNSPVLMDNAPAISKLQEGIVDIAEENANVDEKGKQVEYTLSLENLLVEVNLDNAIMAARVELRARHEEVPMVYRVYSHVYTPVIDTASHHELVKNLSTSTSYIELREKLKAAGEDHPIELVTELNRRATNLVNHILHKRLSILPEDITVDDFVLDLDDLLALVEENYGENVKKALLKDQRKNISSLFKSLDPTGETSGVVYSNLSEDILRGAWADDEDKAPKFTFIGETFSLTLIDMVSHDLQITGNPKIGNGLSPRYAPAMYNLAKNIFNADTENLAVSRNLIITKDGRVLEVTKGDLAQDFYLLSLVK